MHHRQEIQRRAQEMINLTEGSMAMGEGTVRN